MDGKELLESLVSAIQKMRAAQSALWNPQEQISATEVAIAEREVDELVAQYVSDSMPDTQLEPREELFTESAEALRDALPDLPPPPARELPDLSKLLRQWTPEENYNQ